MEQQIIETGGGSTSPATAPQPRKGTSLTRQLGVVGWQGVESVLLAALASEAPLLLVGPHGTAKSLLVERVAAALELEFRHYNAALINYDDIVGIPLPEDNGDGLRFVGTQGAIWGAEFVFLDEISRCRSSLQNKLFPIIHERRVAGMDLPALRFRWAAMNPPSPDEPDFEDGNAATYFGSEPLDPALADRFPFVVTVPSWKQLRKRERQALLEDKPNGDSARPGIHLTELVQAVRDLIPRLDDALRAKLADYVLQLMQGLATHGLGQSPRRARMLLASVISIHAARLVLGDESADLEESARLAVANGIPETSSEAPPSSADLLSAHRQAWEVASLSEDDAWRQILEEHDPVQRVILADKLELASGDLSKLVTRALGSDLPESRRLGLATAVFLRFSDRRNLWPAAWETLARYARRVLEPGERSTEVAAGSQGLERWQEITRHLASQDPSPTSGLERNYLMAGFPDLWVQTDWKEALLQFRHDLETFEIGLEAQL